MAQGSSDKHAPGPLGEYLRARRALLSPQLLGLPDAGRRRVPGLRRHELALLAGVSTEYYTRLEQGRNRHPSPQIVEALAGALHLDAESTAHLRQLAAPAPPRRSRQRGEQVPAGIRMLLETWSALPVVVAGRLCDVRAATSLAVALSPAHRPGANLAREVFLNDAVRTLHRDWDLATASLASTLRVAAGEDPDDPRLSALVGELSVRSARFRHLWARHDVRPKQSGRALLRHPQVGELDLWTEKLSILGTNSMIMLCFHAEPGSASAERLALLASLTAAATPATGPATGPATPTATGPAAEPPATPATGPATPPVTRSATPPATRPASPPATGPTAAAAPSATPAAEPPAAPAEPPRHRLA
ncbi:helix-turn-helix domain-containing protein [Streptomyces sp. NPDC001797]|uniref:helix-turn-helix domain-containing protein n=1 Tax=Streptomyces sp. NPDC001797 TaxID=3364610 RepID=UPI00369BCDA8